MTEDVEDLPAVSNHCFDPGALSLSRNWMVNSLRGPGERGFDVHKSWGDFAKVRCCPQRVGPREFAAPPKCSPRAPRTAGTPAPTGRTSA